MQVTILSEDTVLWQAMVSMQQAGSGARAPGLHLSAILNDIARTVYPKDFAYLADEQAGAGAADEHSASTRSMFEVGNVIEDIMGQVMAQRAGWEKPEPRQCDGIWCSPDGYQARTKTIDEMKVAWKGTRDFPKTSKWQRYVWQVLSYMHVYGATRGRIHVLHINGDYRPPLPVPPVTYIIRPTADEIAENWSMVIGHAKDRGWLPKQRGRSRS